MKTNVEENPKVEIRNPKEVPISKFQVPETEEGQNATCLLSSKGGEGVRAVELLDELEGVLRRFVVLPKYGAETLALWVLHTYAFELREVTTYVGVESPEKRCGKTTLLGVLSELVNRPVVSSNISPPAFFRVIEELKPTLLIDEADTFLQGNEELRGILNAGYSRKTAYVLRIQNSEVRIQNGGKIYEEAKRGGGQEGNDGWWRNQKTETRNPKSENGRIYEEARKGGGQEGRGESGSRLARFSCWCPKVMAAIGRLPETLADRCIIIRMERKSPREECERLRGLEASGLRERCAAFVREHEGEIGKARPAMPRELNDRAADIWEPLLALADIAGGGWPERARQAARGLTMRARESCPVGALLLDLFNRFGTEDPIPKALLSRELVHWLNQMSERPWMEGRKEVTELWLAQQLRPYGVRPVNIRRGDRVGKGYLWDELLGVCQRYIPQSELEEMRRWYEMQSEAAREREKAESRNLNSKFE